jgi:ubiquinone/menaquinone biosynthesis C-methylase UbiE
MQRAFAPGAVDYDGTMSRDFNAGRGLSAESMTVWRSAFEPYIKGAGRVVDVGSGTGRFTVLLAEWFDVVVVGVEPARGMRDVAAGSGRRPSVSYVGGRAEQLPLRRESLTVALLSNVYHHIADRHASAQELQRVLQTGGRVLIRGAFADRLGEITLFDHFPEAKIICEQFPTLQETVATFVNSGFEFEAVERVVQQTCSSLRELANRTRLRADTTLVLMADESFAARQQALERRASVETTPTAVIDTLDLLVLRKVSG